MKKHFSLIVLLLLICCGDIIHSKTITTPVVFKLNHEIVGTDSFSVKMKKCPLSTNCLNKQPKSIQDTVYLNKNYKLTIYSRDFEKYL